MNEVTLYDRHKTLVENDFADLIAERVLEHALKKKHDDRLKELNEEISGLMATVESESVLCNGWKVTLSEQTRKTLKKEKLLAMGVTVDQINSARAFTALRSWFRRLGLLLLLPRRFSSLDLYLHHVG